ncbi:RNA-guided endonuclease TnpB family protein [Bacillus cereus]|uniref:RNA-guided endonuclease TnpB family protein n=1 Tax=Bacillus cereus TaxID=1396 RepID=UPI000A3014D8|nr:RNA-guided endonuclease TnpB family protein [Bacillus cereus]MBL3742301.1 transposase [Bacillus cereus]MBL3864955.1 transposase [Bacillus cereus]SME10958.1 putative transposase [Bacillus cereus]HDR8085992.1 transposase [Bacillus cereus]HDR8465739.1 transposase [Bacillus cereus]
MAKVKTIEERNKELALIGKKLQLYGLKMRVYPNKKQTEFFNQTIGCARFTFNFYFQEKQEIYQATGQTLSYVTFKKSFNALKKHPAFSWLKHADKFALENAMMNLDDAYKRFFKGEVKFPKRKKKHSAKQSYTTNITNGNIKLNVENNTVQLPKAGEVSCKIDKKVRKQLLENGLQGTIKSATVTRHSDGTFFVSLKIEEIVDIKPTIDVTQISDEDIVAGDLGLTHFIILSDGTKIENPRYYQKQLKKLAKMQRKLSKMKKGSNNYIKQRKKIAKLHLHITNMRRDFLHKVSRKLVDENQVIVLENLNVKNMIRNKKLAKSIQDVGWGMFKTFVTYKAEWVNKHVVLVDTFFPSSKLCNGCKTKNTLLSLNEREWVCPSCGEKHDRDQNAALNIKEEGIRLLKEQKIA